jgi:hypothetical protein
MPAATKYQCVLILLNLALMAIGAAMLYYGITQVDPTYNTIFHLIMTGHQYCQGLGQFFFLFYAYRQYLHVRRRGRFDRDCSRYFDFYSFFSSSFF